MIPVRHVILFVLPMLGCLVGCFGSVKPAMTPDAAMTEAESECARMSPDDPGCVERRSEFLMAQDQSRYQSDRADQRARRSAISRALAGDDAPRAQPVQCQSTAVGGVVSTRCQ